MRVSDYWEGVSVSQSVDDERHISGAALAVKRSSLARCDSV